MLAAFLVLHIVGVLTQPLLAPLLWPAIPLAVVGFWRDRPARVGQIEAAEPAKTQRNARARKA
jgi:hypothetical protein